jgi:hypothetical protein
MRMKSIVWNISKIGFLIYLTAVLFGCQSVFNPYEGKTVNADNRIPLMEGGPHEGAWEAKDLSFKYKYVKNSDKVEISGDLSLHAASYWTYELVDVLFFRVNFIDSNDALIESNVLWSTVFGNFTYRWFLNERTLDLPPNTAAMGFSYIGRVRQAGGGGTDLDLWHSPLGS